MKKIFLSIFILSVLFSFKNNDKTQNDPSKLGNALEVLPSFNSGYAKDSIINYVVDVCNKNSKNYIPVKDRIVAFDNDGTLWAEQPLPSQLYFNIYRLKEMAKSGEYTWEYEFPYNAILTNDTEALKKITPTQIIALVGKTNAISDVNNFDPIVNSWIKTAEHPVLKRKFTDCVYQPMLELMDYLRDNDFKIFIVSGGSVEFMRAWAPDSYKVPKYDIIGSTFKTQPTKTDDKIVLSQTEDFEFNDDHEGKVVNINKHIGQKPVMIVGNSDGDLEMMEYAATNNKYRPFLMYVKHTDGKREFFYDDKILAGQLVKGEQVALKNHWTIIDMKRDWKTVFKN